MALTKRVEVLFDPREYQQLVEFARARRETVGALVRQAVEQLYLKPTLAERREAVEGILSEQSVLTWEEAKKLLEGEVGRRFEAP